MYKIDILQLWLELLALAWSLVPYSNSAERLTGILESEYDFDQYIWQNESLTGKKHFPKTKIITFDKITHMIKLTLVAVCFPVGTANRAIYSWADPSSSPYTTGAHCKKNILGQILLAAPLMPVHTAIRMSILMSNCKSLPKLVKTGL